MVKGILRGIVTKTIRLTGAELYRWMFQIAGVVTANWSKISLDTEYRRRTMIKRGRNRKFKRGYAVCQLVDFRNELQLLQQDEKSI